MKSRKNTSLSRKKKQTAKTIKRVFSKKDFNAGDGFVTSIWGPALWHSLHTISFNYPVNPTAKDKQNYRNFMLSLTDILPCRYCRENLAKNYKIFPLTAGSMKNRDTFSRYVYKLHERINKNLGKTSGLSYCDVRERYEHFRARCTEEKHKLFSFNKTRKTKKEKGCTEPLYGTKAKCVIKIVPKEEEGNTFQIDEKCKKTRI